MNKANETLKYLLAVIADIRRRLDSIEKADAERAQAWEMNKLIQQPKS